MVSTRILTFGQVHEAATLLRGGALVAFGTETVYGLGADARNGAAVARIYEAKGRPSFNPLIVHVATAEAAFEIGMPSRRARRLAALWPGPLSMVLPLRAGHGLSHLVTAGMDTVALRVPGGAARTLLAAVGGPVAAPSANPSGRISPTTATHVLDGLSGRIEAVLDTGPCAVGLESTIVGLSGPPALLREGGVPRARIEALTGPLGTATAGITAPGQLASHYAPRGDVRLDAAAPRPGEAMLGFGAVPGELTLSAAGDLREAAANLFGHMRALDDGRTLAVAPIPDEGLGAAINDRLRRAAAPRDG